MKIEDFYNKVQKDISKQLEHIIEEYEDPEKIRYVLEGGKRLRPTLTLLVFKACGGKDYQKALKGAVAGELVHSASLVHDDMIDRDLLRRGKPVAHEAYGVEETILLGHRLVSHGLRTIVNHGTEVVKTFLTVWQSAVRGETQDLEIMKEKLEKLPPPAKKVYFDIILKKTASLFAGASKVGAQEAGANRETQDLFWNYGEKIGLAYQLADDYVDMKRRRKFETLPLLLAAQFEENLKKSFFKLIKEGRVSPIEFLGRLGFNAKTFYRSEIRSAIKEAQNLIKDFKVKRGYKGALKEAPTWTVNKMLAEVEEEI